MKMHRRIAALACVLGVAAAGACASQDMPPGGPMPDVMLVNPGDGPTVIDSSGGTPGLSTQIRVGNLVPELGTIGVCLRPPGTSTWGRLSGLPSPADGGESEGESEGAGPDAGGPEAALEGSPADAPAEALADALADANEEGAPPDGGAEDAAADVTGSEAGPAGDVLKPYSLSRYTRLDGAGTYELAVVPGSASGCAAVYFTQPITLDSDKLTTLLLVQIRPGPLGPPGSYLGTDGPVPFALLALTDEPDTASHFARTRFVNATVPGVSGGATLSVAALDPTADLVPLAATVPPDDHTEPSDVAPTVDALGYHDGYAMSGSCSSASNVGCLALRLAASGDGATLPWTSAAVDLSLGPGSVHTAFLLTGAGSPYKVLWCNDLSQQATLTDCILVAQ